MSDDRIQQGLQAYAEKLQLGTGPAPAAEIRRRAARRRRNQAVAATFAAVLIVGAGLGVILNRPSGPPPIPADPSPSVSVSPSLSTSPSPGPSRTSTVTSNVNQLRQAGVDVETGVLIDVADDGADHWMQVGPGEVVDFTGSAKDDSTEMSLIPAPVTGRNRVLVVPVARPGFCVAATPEPPLALQPCREGDAAQTWRIVPAGDSGQFELEGRFGIVAVEESMIPYGQGGGRTGMQTIRFTG